jgi:hypothetical protein
MSDAEHAAPSTRFFSARQHFVGHPVEIDAGAAVERELERIDSVLARCVPAGATVAIALGSRGAAQMAAVAAQLVKQLRTRSCELFVVPAMGSHGGATAEGQAEALARLGITEASVGAPVRCQPESLLVARTDRVCRSTPTASRRAPTRSYRSIASTRTRTSMEE